MASTCHTCSVSLGPNTIGGLCPACLLATAFKDDPQTSAAVASVPAAGRRFGDYQIIEEIGRGGMGVVYRARQLSLHRIVALKLLLSGPYAEAELRHRFCTEAEAAALQHPGVVAIHEFGEHEGTPFLTMSLVEGCNLGELCAGQPLATTRAAVFLSAIAEAVQHAHDHGVFHRDLKPSNILVDCEDRPHVTDFGIAKRLNDVSDATLTGQVLGSPNYVSPEQAAGRNASVGPATDVYGLGAILYYLLTGRAPFLATSVQETLRLVIETDPLPPRLLNPAVPRDVETVCLKCLEKDPLRRYQTASELALDLKRYLRDEPVTARPPSTSYRLMKFVRRNRLPVGAAMIVALALVVATIVSTYHAVRAQRAEKVAKSERGRAEDLLTFMLGDLRDNLAKVGRLDVLEAVGDKAMAYFASRDAGDLDDTTLVRQAKALTQVGQIRMDQARYADATASFDEAFKRASALVTRHPKNGDMLFERGQAEYWNGFVHWKRGELSAASQWWEFYYSTCTELVAIDPSRSAWKSELAYGAHNLASLRQERGEIAAAHADFIAELTTLERMNALNPTDLDVRFRMADAHSWLGILAEKQGDLTEAKKQYQSQTIELEQLVNAAPGTVRWRVKLADALLFETDVYMETGKFESAAGRLKEARRLIDALVSGDVSNRRLSAVSLNCDLKYTMLAWHQGDLSSATRVLADIRPQLEHLATIEPTDRKFTLRLLTAWRMEAKLRMSSGMSEASAAAKRAIELGETLIREGRATDADVGEYASACVVSSEIEFRAGERASANSYLQRAVELLAPRLPGTRDWRLLDPAARASALLGRGEDAQSIRAQLNAYGYVPLDGWPSDDQSAAASAQISLLQSK